jgi:hypothetical protein
MFAKLFDRGRNTNWWKWWTTTKCRFFNTQKFRIWFECQCRKRTTSIETIAAKLFAEEGIETDTRFFVDRDTDVAHLIYATSTTRPEIETTPAGNGHFPTDWKTQQPNLPRHL